MLALVFKKEKEESGGRGKEKGGREGRQRERAEERKEKALKLLTLICQSHHRLQSPQGDQTNQIWTKFKILD